MVFVDGKGLKMSKSTDNVISPKDILKKYGADSPNDLEDSKKDDFFNEVGKEWKKDPANDDEGVGEEAECLPCQKKKKELTKEQKEEETMLPRHARLPPGQTEKNPAGNRSRKRRKPKIPNASRKERKTPEDVRPTKRRSRKSQGENIRKTEKRTRGKRRKGKRREKR